MLCIPDIVSFIPFCDSIEGLRMKINHSFVCLKHLLYESDFNLHAK